MSDRTPSLPALKAFIRRLLWEHDRIGQDVNWDESDDAFQAEIARIELSGGQFPSGRTRRRYCRWHRRGRLKLLFHQARCEVEKCGMPTFLSELEEAWRAYRAELDGAIARVEGTEDQSNPERFLRACETLMDHYKAVAMGRPEETGKAPGEAPAQGGDNSLALLRVFTNGIVDDRIKQAARLLGNSQLTLNEKLTKINALVPFPPTASAKQLGEMLGVSKQAVMKTDWWIQNRKGERESEVARRQEAHKERRIGLGRGKTDRRRKPIHHTGEDDDKDD